MALQQALQWQVVFGSGEVTGGEQRRWQRWLAADPAHARAWAQVQRTDAHLQALATPAAARALRTPRRNVLGIAVLAAGTGPGAAVRVDAGQQTRFGQDAAQPPEPLRPGATAWTRGLLGAERMRLRDLLVELGRYHRGVLRCDPAVQDLVVSGVYPLDDTKQSLHLLT